jgi:hypothetical protein
MTTPPAGRKGRATSVLAFVAAGMLRACFLAQLRARVRLPLQRRPYFRSWLLHGDFCRELLRRAVARAAENESWLICWVQAGCKGPLSQNRLRWMRKRTARMPFPNASVGALTRRWSSLALELASAAGSRVLSTRDGSTSPRTVPLASPSRSTSAAPRSISDLERPTNVLHLAPGGQRHRRGSRCTGTLAS